MSTEILTLWNDFATNTALGLGPAGQISVFLGKGSHAFFQFIQSLLKVEVSLKQKGDFSFSGLVWFSSLNVYLVSPGFLAFPQTPPRAVAFSAGGDRHCVPRIGQ